MTDFELINAFPARYLDATVEKDIAQVNDGGFALIRGAAVFDVKVSYIRRNLNIGRVDILSGNRLVRAVWYNRPYVKGRITAGAEYLFFGRVKVGKNGARELLNPIFEETVAAKGHGDMIGDTQGQQPCPRDTKRRNLPGIIPVYGGGTGIPASQLKIKIRAALKRVKIESLLPEGLNKAYSLMPLSQAYYTIHNPADFKSLDAARRTVVLDTLSQKIALYRLMCCRTGSKRVRKYECGLEGAKPFIDSLPYTLTDGQQAAVRDILRDLRGGTVMNRLLQGDVGSGKTAVAFCAAYCAVKSGWQAAFMAPTEVLAKQHYMNAVKLFDKHGIRVALVTGSLKKSERDSVNLNIKHMNADIIIGTHALFSEGVEFHDLGLVITDEQHRFGVGQRKRLEKKAGQPDTLVMSATPIPRTLSLIMYGDLNISLLTEKPHKGGLDGKGGDIQTNFVRREKAADMYKFIACELEKGASAYFICARIEDDGDDEWGGGEEVVNTTVPVTTLYQDLKKSVLGKYGVGLLHGKMSEAEKAAALSRFVEGQDKCLASTTVIEVGIDVKTASVIVIYNAERFGLSQLHQLRGRVGRAGQKAYCFLLSSVDNQETLERLNMLKSTQDGFALAEYDFLKRGAGDFLGERQHGGTGLPATYETVTAAKEIAEELLKDAAIRAVLQQKLDETPDLDELTRITMN